jgi:hypothetical protein
MVRGRRYVSIRILKPLLLLCPIIFGAVLLAAEVKSILAQTEAPKLSLHVNPTRGTQEDVFTFSVLVDGISDDGRPMLRGGDDFTLSLSGTQVEMSGSASAPQFRTVYRYRLMPKRTGVLETPTVELRSGAQTLVAEALKVQVDAPRSASRARREEIFLLQSLEKDKVYQGQQVGLTLELFSQRPIVRPRVKEWAVDEFLVQDLPQEDPFERVIEGARFEVLKVRRALYPLREGSLTIPGAKMEASVIVQRVVRMPGLGGMFNFESIERVPEERTIEATPSRLEVLPLPPRPAGYRSLGQSAPVVGVTDLRAAIERENVTTGDATRLSITLSSTGNILGIQEIDIPASGALRFYPEQTTTHTREYLGSLITTRRFTYSVVALLPGRHLIPEVTLDFFDPAEGKYKTARTGDVKLNATGRALVTEALVTEGQAGEAPASPSEVRERRSPPEIPTPSEITLPSLPMLTRLWREISPGSLLMLFLGVVALIGSALLLGRAKRRNPVWVGSTDKLVHAFLTALAQLTEVQVFPTQTVPYEALRIGLRRSTLDQALVFELCTLLDKLERQAVGMPDLDAPTYHSRREVEALAKLGESTLKHIEVLMPTLFEICSISRHP